MTLRLRAAAVEDLDAARRWYREADEALVVRFEDAVGLTFGRIVEQPEMSPVVHRDVRRALVRTFPYAVFDRLLGGDVVVLAVLHLRRAPVRARRRR